MQGHLNQSVGPIKKRDTVISIQTTCMSLNQWMENSALVLVLVLVPSYASHMAGKEWINTRFENAETIGGRFYGLLFLYLFFCFNFFYFLYVGWVSAVGNSLSDSRKFHFSGLRNSLSASTAGKIQPYFPTTAPHLLTTCLTYVQRQLLTIDLDGNVC